MSQTVVKRSGHDEPFDVKKIYASIYAAMLSARETTKTAEYVAAEVSKYVHMWALDFAEVTTRDIRTHAAKKLIEYNDKAHFLYVHHRPVF